MSSLNKAMLIGRLGRDPEIKYLPSGTALCTFSVATTNRWQKDGEWQESTEWHNVTVFGKRAETCAQYLQKGSQVFVEGRLQTDKWEGEDGIKRQATKIIAYQVVFLSKVEARPTNTGSQDQDARLPDDDDIPF